MSRRPRGAGNARGGRGGGRGGGGIVVVPPGPEAPELVPGLKAWFDSRSTDYFALGGGGEVSAWLSRAGTLGGIAWQQGTGSNQPIRVASEPLSNNLPAVRFDGVNNWLVTSNQNAWKFLHDGTGMSIVRVLRVENVANTFLSSNQSNATGHGVNCQFTTTASAQQIANGTGTFLVTWQLVNSAYFARNVTRWQMWGHVAGTSHQRVSGSSLTLADTAGVPSASNPLGVMRLGASVSGSLPVLGHIAQDFYYDHVLTAGETTQLANWAASLYGVAA